MHQVKNICDGLVISKTDWNKFFFTLTGTIVTKVALADPIYPFNRKPQLICQTKTAQCKISLHEAVVSSPQNRLLMKVFVTGQFLSLQPLQCLFLQCMDAVRIL